MTEQEFQLAHMDLAEHNLNAYNYVLAIPPEHYARFAFPVPRFMQLSSNCIESINGAFRAIRKLPILDMIQHIWDWIMKKRLAKFEKLHLQPLVTNA